MFDEDEDQGFMLLVLGVLAAVLMTVLWYVISDEAEPAPVALAAAVETPAETPAEEPADEPDEEAAAPEPTAIPATATAVPEPDPAPVAPAATEPLSLAVQAEGGRIILQGVVPSQDIRSEIAADFDAQFGAENVDNQIEVSENVSFDNGFNVALFGEVESEDYASLVRRSAGVQVASDVNDQLRIAAPEEAEDAPDVAGSLATIFAFNPINFASGSAIIEDSSFPPLNDAVRVLTDNPGIGVRVEGHTDNQGSADGNQILSQQRAEAVVTYLVENGVSADQLSAQGYGADQPIADNGTAEGRAENRRIEFIQLEG